MKKLIPILLILLLASGCVPASVNIQGSATAATKPTPEQPKDLSSLVEIKEYSCPQTSFFLYYVMTIKNNSDIMLEADLNVSALDKDGNLIDGQSRSRLVIAPGQTACEWMTFDKDWQKITKFEHNLNLKESKRENSYKNLEVKTNKTSEGVAISVKNNGSTAARYVNVDIIFLKDGKTVDFTEVLCSDGDSEVKPGQTISASGRCANGSFDDMIVLLNCK